ncbi:allophanate hydrolase subunit 1 [Vibrio aestuarianus]|uniref:Allophanate hydrolase subunit 1 n=1 Tax=Vibrio aestuarianus TaxID=28171 RepID=A0A9X4FIW5_9VIBR|nr:allophanate hydrolase subunit 1 [Vibrio aestuarianus]MDE1357924.1 allophanate hydrolase subunit 1 [Vibrio aestuarianus]
MKLNFSIEPVAECSLLIRFAHPVSTQLSLDIGNIAQNITAQLQHYVMNVTPSYNTILIDYLPYRISQAQLEYQLLNTLQTITSNRTKSSASDCIELPAYYDLQVAPDLARYHQKGLSTEQVIELHSQRIYTVCAIGFTPGFAFMTDVHDDLVMPRHMTPRLSIPKGSVAIAESQTAVYPSRSPGGWNIIANCPLSLFDASRAPMTPFTIGAQVKFTSISSEEYSALGGQLFSDCDFKEANA